MLPNGDLTSDHTVRDAIFSGVCLPTVPYVIVMGTLGVMFYRNES
jgi:hypothetical protein